MKIRTDFVTNSSSSSFCTVRVTLADGRDISFDGCNEYNPFFDNEEVNASLKKIDDLASLVDYLKKCGGLWYEDAAIEEIDSFKDVVSIIVDHRYENAEEPDCGSRGCFTYNFITKEYDSNYGCVVIAHEDKDDVANSKIEPIWSDVSDEWPDGILFLEYSNPIIEKLIKEYKCQYEKVNPFSLYDPEYFAYYGLEDIESITKTVISYLATFCAANKGFVDALLENFDLIMQNFTTLEGSFAVCFDEENCGNSGADFEMRNGKLEYEYRKCYGGW